MTLMFFLPIETWQRLVYWLILGLVVYFAFGYHYSVMRHVEAGDPTPGVPPHSPELPFKGPPETGIKE